MQITVNSKKELETIVKENKGKSVDERMKIVNELQEESQVLLEYIKRITEAISALVTG